MTAWLLFAACVLLIIAAGPALTREARNISDILGWSRTWVGGILLALATSLPELITGVSSVTVANSPNIAVGDALGSCIFNLALLAVLDILCREDSVFSHADQGHVLTASLGTLMIAVTGAGLLTAAAGFEMVIGHVSIYSILLLLMYLIVVRAIFLFETRSGDTSRRIPDRNALRKSASRFAFAGLVVAVGGTLLPFAGSAIADQMDWRTSFVGTLLVAAATSLPELVVMLAALRMRSIDLALGGLLGSNIFDMAIIAIDDLAFVKGSLFMNVSPAHAGTAFGAVIMSSVVIAAIIDRPKARAFGRVGWISVFLVAIYAITAYAIYLHG